MRIAIFSECYTPVANGVVTSIQTLRHTLQAWGHTVTVFAPGAPQADDDSDVFRLPELPFPQHPYHFARPFPRLKIDFAALDVDLIHCQHPFTVGRLGSAIARKYGLPMVYTAHSLYDTMAACAKSPIVRSFGEKAARGVVRRFCSRANRVIVPSCHTRDSLRADGVRARFAVIPSGIIEPQAHEGGRERIRCELNLDEETPLVLCVGRLGPEKRMDLLLRAVAALSSRENLPEPARHFRLALVGDGACRAELEAMALQLGIRQRVLFVGQQPHASIGDWYAAADIFALSSPAETQGLVLVEAMAAGLPCVTVDYGGPREVVAEGETGLRVPFEAGAYADALERLLCNPQTRASFGEKGRARARLLYSPEAMARSVLAVYESALSGPRRTLPVRRARPVRALHPRFY